MPERPTDEVDCPDCHGTGDIAQAVDPSDVVGCPRCDSTGRIERGHLRRG